MGLICFSSFLSYRGCGLFKVFKTPQKWSKIQITKISPIELTVSMNLSIYNLLNLQLLFPESMIYSKIKNTYLHTVMCYITFRSRTDSVHGTVHVTLVPQDYNGAENVLFPSDIVTSRHNTLLICLWRCWGNKPTVPCGTYNYVRYIILDNK